MLQIQHIKKEYRTGTLVQKALDDVSLNLRDNEFVAILGPSGSGKTTLLNIIGGLDRYDSGDLIINGISTKKYKDRDWDSYRNHTIGFVFQSYNLIPHQTVLANVELALTISGVSKEVRRKKAIAALEKVGLGKQLHKRPSQMSGGQMQRVAIARALVNDPEILLADEPTGALDSDTSIQVMDLLQEVAKERLVVMVTHNPELAELYANGQMTGFNSGDIPMTDGFGTGRYIMLLEGPWKTAEMAGAYPDFEYGMCEMPAGEAGSISVLGGEDIAMFNTENKEGAWEFMKFMTSEWAQEQMAQVGQIPVNTTALESDTVAEQDYAPFLEAITTAKARPPVASWSDIDSALTNAMTDIIVNGADVQSTLDALAGEVDKLLAS